VGRARGEVTESTVPGLKGGSRPEKPERVDHRAPEPTCDKLGVPVATAGAAQANADSSGEQAGVAEAHEESSGGFHSVMAEWMTEHSTDEHGALGSAEELNSWLRSHSYGDVSPSDRFHALVGNVAGIACGTFGPSVLRSQPVVVATHAAPIVGRWRLLLQHLFAGVGDASRATAGAVAAVQAAVATTVGTKASAETAMLGIVISLRDLIEGIGDEELLFGCERLPSRGRAVEKFIEFLRDADSDEDGDED